MAAVRRLAWPAVLTLALVACTSGGAAEAQPTPSSSAVDSATPVATPTATPPPTATPAPTPNPTPDTRAADLERARGVVTKLLRYADTIAARAGDSGAIFYSLSETTLQKMYALAEKNRDWVRNCQLEADECSALSEAIAAVDALKMVLDGRKNDDERGLMLAISLSVDIPIWQSDLIALGG